MKTIRTLLTVMAVAAFLAIHVGGTEALDRRVWVQNDTSVTMVAFYASNRDTDDWEEDILGNAVVTPGDGVMVDIDDGTGYCIFDLRAEFKGREAAERFGFNVCENTRWTVYE